MLSGNPSPSVSVWADGSNGKSSWSSGIPSFYDQSGAIGRRYRRQDEIGTPWCITVDGQSTEDGTVTVRDRDSLVQERVGVDQVVNWITNQLS